MNSTNGPAHQDRNLDPDPIPPFAVRGPVRQLDVGPQHPESFAQGIDDATAKVTDLGSIAANNVPPIRLAGGPYAGDEGTPIQFDAIASTSICGADSLPCAGTSRTAAWRSARRRSTRSRTTASSAASSPPPIRPASATSRPSRSPSPTRTPSPTPGPTPPPTGVVSSRSVGTATDPGAATSRRSNTAGTSATAAADRPLGVRWLGRLPRVCHARHVHATLTVSDKDGGFDTDARTSTSPSAIRPPRTSARAPRPMTRPTTLSASLVDEYGAKLNGQGRSLSASTAPGPARPPRTPPASRRGRTRRSWTRAYATGAALRGRRPVHRLVRQRRHRDRQKATTVTYTGALNGGPNKTVGLSAILADASGTRLAGRTIAFQLGTQSVSAVTDASGVASWTSTQPEERHLSAHRDVHAGRCGCEPLHRQ